MPAPEGNRFWELRSKHGRDTLFADSNKLWEAACEYFIWCEEHPLIEIDYKGKDAIRVEMPKMRPFTMQGLCSYLGCNMAYFREFNTEGKEDFSLIISRIKETVYNQKYTGAASGFLNPNIVMRDLGLVDKQQTESNTNLTVNISKQEAKDISDALDGEF